MKWVPTLRAWTYAAIVGEQGSWYVEHWSERPGPLLSGLSDALQVSRLSTNVLL